MASGEITEAEFAAACAAPGMRIRSAGRGRGLARGRGYGPMGTCELTPAQAAGFGLITDPEYLEQVTGQRAEKEEEGWLDSIASWITEASGYMAPTESEIEHLETNVQRLEQNISEREHQGDPPPQSSYTAVDVGAAEIERMKEQRDKIWPPDKYVKYAKYALYGIGALFAYRLLKDFHLL